MIKNSIASPLLQNLFAVLHRHRAAFGQERVYWRAVGMVLGEIYNFGRHTVMQGLMALGMTDGDWSGRYRLFSQRGYKEERVAKIFVRRAVCCGHRWCANSRKQSANAGDELAKSTENLGVQSWYPSRPTIYEWLLADPDGSWLIVSAVDPPELG